LGELNGQRSLPQRSPLCELVSCEVAVLEHWRELELARRHLIVPCLRRDFGEPIFYLVEPGGVSRRVVELDGGVSGEELLNPLGLVRREIVGNEMNLLACSTSIIRARHSQLFDILTAVRSLLRLLGAFKLRSTYAVANF